MRQAKTYARELRASYLYANGALVEWFEEMRDRVRIGSTVDITYGYADIKFWPGYRESSGYRTNIEGRLILGPGEKGLVKFLKRSRVEAIAPSFEGGSENTRKHNISVGYLKVFTKKFGELTWHVFGNILSTGITIQTEAHTKFPARDDGNPWMVGMHFFTDTPISKITNLTPEVPAPDAAPVVTEAHVE